MIGKDANQTAAGRDSNSIKFNVLDHGDRGEDVGFKPDCAEVSRASIGSATFW
jgi:hypothetical protein